MCDDNLKGSAQQMKIFEGSFGGRTADKKFGEWIEEHPKAHIIDFKYRHIDHDYHSIIIMYTEE